MDAATPLPLSGRDPDALRGDRIAGEQYFSREFAQAEWDRLWTRIWHIAGRTADIPEPGDYVVHNFLKESVICVRQRSTQMSETCWCRRFS